MKRLIIGLACFVWLADVCSASQATPVPTIDTSTTAPSPFLTATATQTSLPSATPTASITPLPTIPTFTPTFDASTIVTVTPAPKAECPKENLSLVPTFYIPKYPGCFDKDQCIYGGTEKEILEFLNKGGTSQSVISTLHSAIYGNYNDFSYQDITGDGIPELMFLDFDFPENLHIYYCQNGEYHVFSFDPDTTGYVIQFVKLESVIDLNSNNLPEVVFVGRGCMGSGCFVTSTFEWNGNGFTNLSPQAFVWGLEKINFQDVDGNGTKEIILTGDVPGIGTYSMKVPWRLKTDTYTWNGQEYVLASEDFEPPQFRFQAVQDADRYVLEMRFDKAVSFYQDVISNDKLDWWSLEKRIYYINDLDPWSTTNTPGPTPIPDPTEYPRLAAYAYLRIMLLQLVQNHESAAATIYSTLQQKFGSDPYARRYVEMATAFWDVYQSTHKMYDGCAAAIQYAVEHPEILIPLGSDYHGSQSHIYVPADVCPFR